MQQAKEYAAILGPMLADETGIIEFDFLPRLAIAFFAGVRVAELDPLDWSAVDLSADTITIEPAVAKMRRQRHVTVMANLHEWLLPCHRFG